VPREELSALVGHHKHLRGGGNADVAYVGWSAHIAKIAGLVSGGIEREGAFWSATVGAVHTERSLCRAALSELDGQFAAIGCDADRDVLEVLNDDIRSSKAGCGAPAHRDGVHGGTGRAVVAIQRRRRSGHASSAARP
jgi:hypothetical protein